MEWEKQLAAQLRGKFLTSFTKWVESEVSRHAEDLSRVKAVGLARFGPDKIGAAIKQTQEDNLANDLGVT